MPNRLLSKVKENEMFKNITDPVREHATFASIIVLACIAWSYKINPDKLLHLWPYAAMSVGLLVSVPVINYLHEANRSRARKYKSNR